MKRKQITLPDELHDQIEQTAGETETRFSHIVTKALRQWLYIRQYRRVGWRFYRRKDNEEVEVNFVD